MQNVGDNPQGTEPMAYELRAAGIPPTGATGALVYADGRVVQFERRWVYWSAQCFPAIPHADAVAIDNLDRPGGSTYYGGSAGTLGDVVRVDGFAGGHEPLSWEATKRTGVSHYHIDTQAALEAFVRALSWRFGTPVASATPEVAVALIADARLAAARAEKADLAALLRGEAVDGDLLREIIQRRHDSLVGEAEAEVAATHNAVTRDMAGANLVRNVFDVLRA